MASRTKKARPAKGRAVQTSTRRLPASSRRWGWALAGAGAVAVVALIVGVAMTRSNGGSGTAPAREVAAGLPDTPDYHSLMVSPTNAKALLLGTHYGLFRSADGGRTWASDALGGQDAMNLVRPDGQTLWVAGHTVLAKSIDNGKTWSDVRPTGLPGLDVHGFAADPRNSRTLYAAIAGKGLYRSTDGGNSFSEVSRDVGPAVMALAVMRDGRITTSIAEGESSITNSARSGVTSSNQGSTKHWNQEHEASRPRRNAGNGGVVACSCQKGTTR